MKAVEIAMVILLAAGGLRSLVVWTRRRFDTGDAVDHALYALFVTGRVGLWWSLAGLFALYASSDAEGRAASDELAELRWFLLVPLVLAAAQFLAAYFLGRRRA